MAKVITTYTSSVQNARIQWCAGKTLTHTDLNKNNQFFAQVLQRLHSLAGFGVIGEIFDLAFRCSSESDKILIAPGLALDAKGNWLVVNEPISIDRPTPQADGCYLILLRHKENIRESETAGRELESNIEVLVSHLVDQSPENVGSHCTQLGAIEIARWPAKVTNLSGAEVVNAPTESEIDQTHIPRIILKCSLSVAQQVELQSVADEMREVCGSFKWLDMESRIQTFSFLDQLSLESTRSTWHRSFIQQLILRFARLLRGWQNNATQALPQELQKCVAILEAFANELNLANAEAGLLRPDSMIELLQVVSEGLGQLPEQLTSEQLADSLDLAVSFDSLPTLAEMPEAVVRRGLVFDLLDFVVLGDEDSEHDHHLDLQSDAQELTVAGLEWHEGEEEVKQGYRFGPGSLSVQFSDLDPGLDAFIVLTIDASLGLVETQYRAGEQSSRTVKELLPIPGKWRNVTMEVAGAAIADESLELELSVSSASSCFGLAIYQQRP